MLVLGLVACGGGAGAPFDADDVPFVGDLVRLQVQSAFHGAWCACAGDLAPHDPPPGRLGCDGDATLVADGENVSGVSAGGADASGTMTWAPGVASFALELQVEEPSGDELAREIRFAWDGSVAGDAATPDLYEVTVRATGEATLTRPKYGLDELQGEVSDRELEADVTHSGPIDLDVAWRTWDDGNCIGSTETWSGTVGEQPADEERTVCLTPPLN